MNNLLNNYDFTDALISALGNTILHSLWQGVILAVLGGLVVVLGKHLSSALRYMLLVGILSAFLLSIIATFAGTILLQRTDFTSMETTVRSPEEVLTHTKNGLTLDDVYEQLSYLFGSFRDYYSFIVLLWFMVVCIKSVRMCVNLYGVFRLKNTGLIATDMRWQRLVDHICKGIGVTQRVAFHESILAKTPLIIGHFKPLVLFPIGLVTSLSVEQVEAVLAHELAHVRRNDFIVNLVQNAIEILFFFNPAVLWLSSLIRAERENCCDDIAVAYTGSKSLYVNALVQCEEYSMSTPHLAVGLKGDRGTLINRVKRLLKKERPTLNLVERLILAICLSCTMVVGIAIAVNPISTYAKSKYQDIEWTQDEPRVQGEKIVEELIKMELIHDRKNFRLRITNEALYINGKRQPEKIHRHIMQRYVKNPDHRLDFTQTVKTD
ncbi:BlaR1 peptidase M56 [Sphingobacterium alimentarium]|uniref:BlaR1 peptidase M56 n=1 Tax=Sphingobacterium alimentarium TaxID=797292 RepID=A0A4V2VUJ2_9SPHI|nr:M56 family metallopeptidase [Sphingobacterium alimentarium]TCV19623.1 BlaR1 peptidase M56 [Sphingobacterium alimentarium]